MSLIYKREFLSHRNTSFEIPDSGNEDIIFYFLKNHLFLGFAKYIIEFYMAEVETTS